MYFIYILFFTENAIRHSQLSIRLREELVLSVLWPWPSLSYSWDHETGFNTNFIIILQFTPHRVSDNGILETKG